MLFWLATLIAVAPPGSPSPSQPIFTAADYPPEAIRNHWEGIVVADLTISVEGRPATCQIAQSSGHKVLDDATCDLIMHRAVFTPAKDAAGNPTTDTFRTPPITWRLP
jgi:protein TonB